MPPFKKNFWGGGIMNVSLDPSSYQSIFCNELQPRKAHKENKKMLNDSFPFVLRVCDICDYKNESELYKFYDGIKLFE